MKTLAAILLRQGEPLVVDEIDMPALDVGQVLVRVMVSGICGSQLGEIDGVKGPDRYLPHLLGHEGGGVVMEIGPGVTTVSPGDRVVLHWRAGSGIESVPPKYRRRGELINAGCVTTFNHHAVVSENRVTAVASDISFEAAALMGCAILTGLGVVVNDAKLSLGESIIVIGAGGVGLNVIQGAALTTALPIIAVDLHENKLRLARKLGATHTLSVDHADPIPSVREILGPGGADVVVETTGKVSMIETAYELAGHTGRVILVGVPRQGDNISIHSLPLHFGRILTGSHGGGANPSRDIPRYAALIRSGKLRVDDLVSRKCSLEEINEAIEEMRSGEIPGRCLIEMPKELTE